MLEKNKLENKIYIIASAVIAISLVLCSSLDWFASCRQVRNDVLRLHIIANSDSQADQAVKLMVRDELLKSGNEIFSGDITASEAQSRLSGYLSAMEDTANRVLAENGFDYISNAEISYEFFSTREYDGFTLPAGRYTALKIVLGEGEGKNWWCVMFPPLCLPAASESENDIYSVFSDDEIKVISPAGGYKVRFKIVEIVESVIEKIRH
ncbi:MAG: stage II sporulation protein R [Oscillospiraceae bacterium]|nr:stage II sporulation protein R [Oscillospiraceae bacterium]